DRIARAAQHLARTGEQLDRLGHRGRGGGRRAGPDVDLSLAGARGGGRGGRGPAAVAVVGLAAAVQARAPSGRQRLSARRGAGGVRAPTGGAGPPSPPAALGDNAASRGKVMTREAARAETPLQRLPRRARAVARARA